ncbi:uncharacterized protein LOC144129834 [Amblyomma americanum]
MNTAALLLLAIAVPRMASVSGYTVHFNLSSEVPFEETEVETSRSRTLSMLPLALLLSGPALALAVGTLKPALLALGLLYLTMFGLTYLPIVGEVLEASFRALGSSVRDSVSPVFGSDLLRAAGLDSDVCRTRAICEITEEAVHKYPTMAAMLRSLTGAVQAQGNDGSVLKGLLGGLSGLGCESLYSSCAHSPFDRLIKSLS